MFNHTHQSLDAKNGRLIKTAAFPASYDRGQRSAGAVRVRVSSSAFPSQLLDI